MKPSRRKQALDALAARYGRAYLDTDPVVFAHRYSRPDDREVAAFVAAALAFGGVAQIRRSVENLLGEMGPRPARWVRGFRPDREGESLRPFVHRFTRGPDVACMFWLLRAMLRAEGSIEGFFSLGHAPDAPTVREGLTSFSARALALDPGPFYGGGLPRSARVRFFFTSPADGSACKRANLFLRWMARPADGVDLGIWRAVRPSQLIIPLDTHVSRVSRRMGLTGRTIADWKMAEEITAALRRIDPEDPCRYDFALCRPGILGICREGGADCAECPLASACAKENIRTR
jgi:uncharacterized protein (TIGR02757 family)